MLITVDIHSSSLDKLSNVALDVNLETAKIPNEAGNIRIVELFPEDNAHIASHLSDFVI